MAIRRESIATFRDRVDRSPLRGAARAAWRQLWGVRRAVRRVVDALGLRMLYGLQAGNVPLMEYPPGHYHSPIPSASEVEAFAHEVPRFPDSVEGVDLRLEGQLELLERLAKFYDDQPFTEDGTSGTRYRFRNDFFPRADAVILHCLLRLLRPRRVIEIGSGWSTCVTLDTSERFLEPRPELLLIEPFPDRLLELVREGDPERFQLERARLQDVPLQAFRTLEANDILFVDSTHITQVGSDVNHLLFEILPVVARGVYVHLHDIQYPFEYGRDWIAAGRFWNEAYLVRAFLQYNAAFEIALFVDQLRTRAPEHLRARHPLLMDGTGPDGPEHGGAGSLWLRRVD
jgi:hypothetical protein